MKLKGLTALAALALAAFAAMVVLPADSASAQGAPAPMVFRGTVAVAGQPAPDGYDIFARITATDGTVYQSPARKTKGGVYSFLTVAPPLPQRFGARSPYHNQEITFYLNGEQAAETATYMASGLPGDSIPLNLTFAALPTPTPLPTVPPTATPPVPPTPVHTATPTVADPMTFASGLIAVTSGAIPQGAQLTARIGDYESEPVTIAPDGNYYGLIVDPGDPALIGEDIKFFISGIESLTTEKFASGAVKLGFPLVFQLPEIPTATPEPMPTATHTPMPPPTPVPPPTPAPATPPTPIPTPVPPPTPEPTATPMPVPTPVPPTPEPEPTAAPEPTATAAPEPEATNTPMAPTAPPPPPEPTGGCGAPVSGNLPFGTAAANLALLLAPLGLIGVGKLTIRHRRRRR